MTLVSASREMLEHHLRRRVRALPNLTVTDGCDVVGLTETGGRITGVRVLPRGDHSDEHLLDADLVVAPPDGDRGHRSGWPTSGLVRPEEEQFRIDLAYTTRRYRLPAETLDGDLGLLQAPTRAHPRGAALARLEHGMWMLTLIGLRGDVPPADPDGFDHFAASVGSEELQAVIGSAEPLDAPATLRFSASRRRHYERTRLPENLWIVGDSLASFNPVYGQGMTVAAIEVVAGSAALTRAGATEPRGDGRAGQDR